MELYDQATRINVGFICGCRLNHTAPSQKHGETRGESFPRVSALQKTPVSQNRASYPFPENPPYVFASVSRDDVEIMFQRIEGYQKPGLYHLRSGGVWDAYIRMEGVKELYEAIRDKVEIKMALRQQPYGDWEFEVKDPNGYILVFSELVD